MLLRLGTALLLLAVLPGLGTTEDAPERAPLPAVDELIQQLGHKDGRVREQANQALEAQGRPFFHSREFILEASAGLALVTREARRIKRLRGVVPLTLLVEQKPEFVVDEVLLAKNKSFKSAQTELTVQSVEKNAQDGQRFNVKFAVRNVGARSEYNFYDSIRNRFELQDAKGNKYRWSGGSWGGSDSNVSGTFGFSHPGGSAGPPAKLIFYEWTTLLHRVAFDFKDLPLP